MQSIFNYKVIIWAAIMSLLCYDALSQASTTEKVIETQSHVFLSLGGGQIKHSEFATSFADIPTNRGKLGLHAGGSFSLRLAQQIAIGLGVDVNYQQGGLAFVGDIIINNVDSTRYAITDGTNPEDIGYTLTDQHDSTTQQFNLTVLRFSVPIYYEISTLQSGGKVFLNFGPTFSFPVGDGSGWKGTGENSAYSGDFSDYFDDKGAKDGLNLVIDDIPNWGFSSTSLVDVEENDNREALFSGASVGFFIAPGVRFPLGNDKRQVTLEAVVHGNLNLKGTASPKNPVGGRREGDTWLPNLSGEAGKIGWNYAGIRAGITLMGELKTGGKEKSKEEGGDNPEEVKEATLTTVFTQSRITRRNTEQNDSEFDKIMESESRNLRYKSVLNPGEMAEDGKIRYNAADPTNIRKISPAFEGRNAYMRYEDHIARNGEIRVEISPQKRTFRQKISILPIDTEGNPVNGFEAQLRFENVTWQDKKMNNGDLLTDLYRHPSVEYALTLTHPCYETLIQPINFDSDWEAGLRVTMRASGQMVRLEVPISGISAMNAKQTLNGELSIRNDRSEVSGNQQGNLLILNGGCGLEVSGRSALTITKPKGFDIRIPGQSSEWKDAQITLPMQDRRALQSVEIVSVPIYNLMYVDISNSNNRELVINTVEALIQDVEARNGQMLGYLSNGASPRVISQTNEKDQLLQGVAQDNPEVPNAQGDLTKMEEYFKQAGVMSSRQDVVLNFFLSEIIYERSREIIIKNLIESLGEDTEDVVVRIYTETPIPEAKRMQLNLQNEIEYRVLK